MQISLLGQVSHTLIVVEMKLYLSKVLHFKSKYEEIDFLSHHMFGMMVLRLLEIVSLLEQDSKYISLMLQEMILKIFLLKLLRTRCFYEL